MHIPLQHWKCHLHLKWGWNPWWQWRNLVITLQFKYIYYIKFQVKRKFYNFGKKKLKWCSPGGVYQALVIWWGGRTDQDYLRLRVPGTIITTKAQKYRTRYRYGYISRPILFAPKGPAVWKLVFQRLPLLDILGSRCGWFGGANPVLMTVFGWNINPLFKD